MATIALQRSKKLLEDEGYHVWIVEHYNQWSKRRMDLFNMCDLVAIRHDMNGITGIQCCSEDVGPHLKKLLEGYTDPKGREWPKNPHLPVWLAAGNRFFIWSWVKRSSDGRGSRKTFQLREIEFFIENAQVVHRGWMSKWIIGC